MHIDDFAPFITSVDALSENASGMGATRRCHFENGTFLVEKVIAWHPGQSYRVQMSDMDPIPFKDAFADISIARLDAMHSTVTWSLNFKVKYGPFGWLLGQLVMKRALGKVLDANLNGLADAINTPES